MSTISPTLSTSDAKEWIVIMTEKQMGLMMMLTKTGWKQNFSETLGKVDAGEGSKICGVIKRVIYRKSGKTRRGWCVMMERAIYDPLPKEDKEGLEKVIKGYDAVLS
jgi:hypothetical protein